MAGKEGAALEIRAVSKSFAPPILVVDHVSLLIEDGETLCILGPSGSGKTTLLRMVAGLEEPDAGQITYAGTDLVGVAPQLRVFGMMFQDFALFPHMNVFNNVAFGLRMHKRPQPEINKRVQEMLELVDLHGYDLRAVDELSGGEQQRVALARALAPEPAVLLLDEPLGALDRALRERLMLEIRDILSSQKITAMYVTHDQMEAFAVADRVAVMNNGKVEQVAAPQLLYQHPVNEFVARFLGFQNLLPGQSITEGHVRTDIGEFSADGPEFPQETAVSVLIKPAVRRVESVGDTARGDTRLNEVEGIVTSVSFRGRYYQLWLRAGNHDLLFEPEGEPKVKVGEMVRILSDRVLVYEA